MGIVCGVRQHQERTRKVLVSTSGLLVRQDALLYTCEITNEEMKEHIKYQITFDLYIISNQTSQFRTTRVWFGPR